MGVNCELCADGFYRPSERHHRQPDACVPCDCDSIGSTGLCIKDDSMALEGIVRLMLIFLFNKTCYKHTGTCKHLERK